MDTVNNALREVEVERAHIAFKHSCFYDAVVSHTFRLITIIKIKIKINNSVPSLIMIAGAHIRWIRREWATNC